MHKGQDQVNFVEVYIVKRILISFNCFSEYRKGVYMFHSVSGVVVCFHQ